VPGGVATREGKDVLRRLWPRSLLKAQRTVACAVAVFAGQRLMEK
jgi:hypothetical protein